MLPKEHGAYGQLILPIVTALGVAGVSSAGLLLTASAAAGFIAHEPASILLGLRGARARRERRNAAIWWVSICAGISVAAATIAVVAMERDARWSIAVPIVPAVLLGIAAVGGREKSWYGELAAAGAFAGLAVPLSLAGNATVATGAAVAAPFVLLFVTSTLAVRTVILRVRGGGDVRAAAAARTSTFAVAGAGAACLSWLTAMGVLPAGTLIAAAPGLLMATVIAARPPQPTRLRTIGWTLVAVSALTAAIILATV